MRFHLIRTSGLDEYLVCGLGEPRLVLGLHADDVARVLREPLDRRPRQPRAVPLPGRVARLQGAHLPLRLLVEYRHLRGSGELAYFSLHVKIVWNSKIHVYRFIGYII